jgi:hypothetical protein
VAGKTVAQKARVEPGATIAVINRVPGIVESLGLPDDVAFVEPTAAQLVFLFVRTGAELEARSEQRRCLRRSSGATYEYMALLAGGGVCGRRIYRASGPQGGLAAGRYQRSPVCPHILGMGSWALAGTRHPSRWCSLMPPPRRRV